MDWSKYSLSDLKALPYYTFFSVLKETENRVKKHIEQQEKQGKR